MGCTALALVLCFSGMISYFELRRLSESTRASLGVSLSCVDISKQMLDAVQTQNTALLQLIVPSQEDSDSVSALYLQQARTGQQAFEEAITQAKLIEGVATSDDLDSIITANARYNEVVDSYLEQQAEIPQERVEWFMGLYKTTYQGVTTAIKNLMLYSHSIMDSHIEALEDNAYRATRPGIIALAIGVLIILVFFHMLNIYYLSPTLLMNQGLRNYLRSRVPFSVHVEGKDEIRELKEAIEALIKQSKAKKSTP